MHAVHCVEEVGRGEFFGFGRKIFLEDREKILPEGESSAHIIFPESGLGFMNAEGNGLAQGVTIFSCGEALFVQSVSTFMDRAPDNFGEVFFIYAGCGSHV